MDYESKYNELVEAARAVVEGNPGLCKIDEGLGRLSKLLPEKEIEDERIRKRLVEYFNGYYDRFSSRNNVNVHWEGLEVKAVIAYLEKQKEQKPANSEKPKEWIDNFEENIRNLLHDKLTDHSEDGSMSWTTLIDDKTLKDIVNGIWFYVGKEALKYPNKELSQPEWSEEDEKYLNLAINIVASDFGKDSPTVSWLKSLRPQPHWKPSEEQMAMLRAVLNDNDNITSESANITLQSLYNDLKKL